MWEEEDEGANLSLGYSLCLDIPKPAKKKKATMLALRYPISTVLVKRNGLRNLDGDGERTKPVDDSSVLLRDLSCYSSLSFSLLFLLHDFICHVWRLQIFNSNM